MDQEQIILTFAKKRQWRIGAIVFAMLTVVLIPYLLDGRAPEGLRLGIAIAGVGVMLYQQLVNWRCPKCGRHLGREFSYRHCPHCATKLMA